MLSIIVAISENYAIGKAGDLLCHLPNDLKHFKELTTGATVVMGKNTFFSLPRRPLPNRRNIVLTRDESFQYENTEVAHSIDHLLSILSADEKVFIIGGGEVYKQFMPLVDELQIKHIHHTCEDADTFFPDIDPSVWSVADRSELQTDPETGYTFEFVEYVKR